MRILFTLAVILFAIGEIQAQNSVKIYSANLQHGRYTDGSFQYGNQAIVLTSGSVDVVAANEVSIGADLTAWDNAFAAAGFTRAIFDEHPSGGDGNAVWYRNSTITQIQTYTRDLANGINPTSGSSTFGWNGSTDIRRSVVAAKLSKGGMPFYVVVFHGCPIACEDNSNTNFATQRVNQINDLNSWVNSTFTDAPVTIVGDFNLPPNYPRGTEISFTVNTSTDVITATNHGWTNGTAVVLRTTGTIPGGLVAGDSIYGQATVYYIRDITTNTFKVSQTLNGAAIDITSTGSGSNFVVSTQLDLFNREGYINSWEQGVFKGLATANWGDRDGDTIPDMPIGFQTGTTRTLGSRFIDYALFRGGVTLQAIDIPDLRANCSVALTTTGNFKECPDVTVGLIDFPEDQGVRPSDHNWFTVTLNLATANFSLPSTAFTGEPVLVDGTNSTGVNGQEYWSAKTCSDGSSPILYDFGDNLGTYSKSKLLKSTHVFLSAGTYNVQLTINDCAGNTNSVSHSITISDIPTATGGNILTAVEQGTPSANATHIQSLINSACGSRTVEKEIRIPNSMQITGQLNTSSCTTGDKYLTIRPVDFDNLPSQNRRVNPTTHAAFMPKISSPGVDLLPLTIPANSRYIRIIGIEFNKQAGHLYQFIEIGSGVSTYSQIPHHIIIDRCYFKGNLTDNTARAIFVNADSFSLLNSYTENMKDGGADAQSIAGFVGSLIAIINNYLDGLGENILFGGADAGIKFQSTVTSGTSSSATLSSVANLRVGDGISFVIAGTRGPWSASIVRSISGNDITFDQITTQAGVPTAPDTTANAVKFGGSPQNIVIRRNYLFKSLTFRVLDPSYGGIFSVVKNSFELKHAMNVIFDGNIIENNWGGQGQSGPTILLTPRNQTCFSNCTGQGNPWTMVRDVHLTNSIVKNVAGVINILGTDNLNLSGTAESGPSAFVQYVLVENLLISRVDPTGLSDPPTSSGGEVAFIFPGARHITINHNTQTNLSGNRLGSSTVAPIGSASYNVKFINNIGMHRSFGFIGDGLLANNFVNTFFPDGFIIYNVITDDINGKVENGGTWIAPRTAPNYFPSNMNNVLIDYINGNFRLQNNSAFKANGATPAADGTDMGANIDVVNNSTSGAISGEWTATIKKCNWHANPKCNQ